MPAELGPEFAQFEKNYQESLKAKKPEGASLSGHAPRYSVPSKGMGGTSAAYKAPASRPQRQPTPEELNRLADQMMAQIHAQHSAQMARGPAVSLEQSPPPWLQDYMATQPKTNPYAPIPPPAQMTPEQRQAYGAERPAWLQPRR